MGLFFRRKFFYAYSFYSLAHISESLSYYALCRLSPFEVESGSERSAV